GLRLLPSCIRRQFLIQIDARLSPCLSRRSNLAVSVHRDQGAESTRLRRFGTGSSTIDSGPPPPRRAFVRRNRPFRLRCSGTAPFNAGSASGLVATRLFGGVRG